MSDIKSLVDRLKEAKFQCIDCRMEETAVDFDDAISMIEQQDTTITALESRVSQQARTIAEMCQQSADSGRDAEILRTLIYRTHACDLKFTKTGSVSALSATFKSNTVPGHGMSEGVRLYLDAFVADAAIAASEPKPD